MKKRVLLLFFLFFSISYGQNRHNLMLAKSITPLNQWYYHGTQFPKDSIEKKWGENYLIRNINNNGTTWFVVMDLVTNPPKQRYSFNPSEKVVGERTVDGYEITDVTGYRDSKGFIGFLAVFTRKQKTIYNDRKFWGKSYYNPGWSKKNMDYIIKNRHPFPIKILKSFKNKGTVYDIIVLDRNISKDNYQVVDQFITARKDPTDKIDDMESYGYNLACLTYDYNIKSWWIVMNKYSPSFQYKKLDFKDDTSMKELDDLIQKDYYIYKMF